MNIGRKDDTAIASRSTEVGSPGQQSNLDTLRVSVDDAPSGTLSFGTTSCLNGPDGLEEFADVQLKFGANVLIYAHRAVLAARSQYFLSKFSHCHTRATDNAIWNCFLSPLVDYEPPRSMFSLESSVFYWDIQNIVNTNTSILSVTSGNKNKNSVVREKEMVPSFFNCSRTKFVAIILVLSVFF